MPGASAVCWEKWRTWTGPSWPPFVTSAWWVGKRSWVPVFWPRPWLDLTADRILDAKTGSRHLTQVLFGNTADACLRHLRDDVPDSALRREFDRLFRREPLLDAFRQGTDRLWLEHPLTADSGVGVWSRTEVELAEDPETGHTVAFCTLEDDSVRRQREAVLEALALRDYEFLLTVDAASGLSRVYGRFRDRVPPDTVYRVLLARYLHQWVPSSKQRTALRNALRLETALEHLEAGPMYDYRFPRMDGQVLQARWSWLDRDSGVLLLTGQLLPPGLPLTPAPGGRCPEAHHDPRLHAGRPASGDGALAPGKSGRTLLYLPGLLVWEAEPGCGADPQAEVYVSEQDGSLDGFWALQTARSPASSSAPIPVPKGSEQPCSKRSCLWGSLCIFVSMRRMPPPCAFIAAQASALTSGGRTRKLVNRSWS